MIVVSSVGIAADRFLLPPELSYPEGIGYDGNNGAFYVVGSVDAVISRVDIKTGAVRVIAAKQVAAQLNGVFPGILGVHLDTRGRLWLAGGLSGKIYVVDPKTGRLIRTIEPPEGPRRLINDIAFAAGKAFMTDTLQPVLWAADAGKTIRPKPEAWLEFGTGPLQYAPGANLNGICATPDGRALIVGQTNKGLLFKIDIASRSVVQIDLLGETVTGNDGLYLVGHTPYLVRQPDAQIVAIKLAPDFASGSVVSRYSSPELLWPATDVVVGNELFVVNTQFNKRQTNSPERPFSVQRVPLVQLAGH
jgi:Cu-Zn family superoxide dismutase